MVDRLRRAPAWAWLAVIVAGSIAFRAWLGSRMPAPFIFTDELHYQENARSLAAGAGIQVRDEPFGIVSVLYPLLLAPAYLLFDSLPDAYAAARTINAVVMSLAAIPAYLIARRLLPARPVAAGGAARGRAARRSPTPARSCPRTRSTRVPARGVGAAVRARRADAAAPARPARGLRRRHARARAGHRRRPRGADRAAPAPARRPQAAAPVAALLRHRRRRRRARARRAARARRSISSLFGAYQVVGEESYDVVDVLKYLFWHLAELDLYVGVIPFAAFLLLAARIRSLEPRVQAFVAATIVARRLDADHGRHVRLALRRRDRRAEHVRRSRRCC